MTASPSVRQVCEIIDGLLAGERSRSEVASWANKLFSDDDIRHTKAIARVLESLGGADLIGIDRPYLFDHADFLKWRQELAE
jgi:hypothetical protein